MASFEELTGFYGRGPGQASLYHSSNSETVRPDPISFKELSRCVQFKIFAKISQESRKIMMPLRKIATPQPFDSMEP